jgi:CRISPR-associated protein Cas2
MGELAPGVYVAPRMTPGVRSRVWTVMEEWHQEAPDRAVVMLWPDINAPGAMGMLVLGVPRNELCEVDDFYLVRRPLTGADEEMLAKVRRRAQHAGPPPDGGIPP